MGADNPERKIASKYRRVPEENFSRAESLASMDRLEELARVTRARVIVQHDEDDFDSLPNARTFFRRIEFAMTSHDRLLPCR